MVSKIWPSPVLAFSKEIHLNKNFALFDIKFHPLSVPDLSITPFFLENQNFQNLNAKGTWDWLKCGLRAAGCGPQIAGCGYAGHRLRAGDMRAAGHRLRAAGHKLRAAGMRAAGHRLPTAGCGAQIAGWGYAGLRVTDCQLWATGCGLRAKCVVWVKYFDPSLCD